VNHHVAGVDQNPVAVRQAFDPRLAEAVFLESAEDVIRQGADVTVRAAGRHDEAVGHGALVRQVDVNDVLRLVVVQTGQDQGLEGLDVQVRREAGMLSGRLGGNRIFLRNLRGVATQRNAPYGVARVPLIAQMSRKREGLRERGGNDASQGALLSRSRIAVDDAKFSGPVR